MMRSMRAIVSALVLLAVLLSGVGCGPAPDVSGEAQRLTSAEAEIRLDAAKRLGEIGTDAAVTALMQALRDSDPRVQRAAVLALAKIGSPAVLRLAAEIGVGQGKPPILEFDPAHDAMIDPGMGASLPALPGDAAILCFFPELIAALASEGDLTPFYSWGGDAGNRTLYTMTVNGQPVAVLHPGVGAPLAASSLEMLIAMGARRIIIVGGGGALRENLALGDLVVVDRAVRDEGTSYHYLPAAEPAEAAPDLVRALEKTLRDRQMKFATGSVWTTDAIYRETRGKVGWRREQGCLLVEMETAALFAVGAFRNVQVAALIYAGDNLGGDRWDHRDWRNVPDLRRTMLLAAAECLTAAVR